LDLATLALFTAAGMRACEAVDGGCARARERIIDQSDEAKKEKM